LKKLAIITTHPIQYNAPLFRLLTERNNISIKVFYTWGQTKEGLVYDPDFKREIKWDIPLLDGYEHEFVENSSPNPGAGHFNGVNNKDLIERVEQYNPAAILIYGWSFKSHLKVLRWFKGKKKIIFRGDSTLLDEANGFSLKKTARRIFLNWVYRFVDIALYTGEGNKAYFIKHGLTKEQLFYAAHAVENERFFDDNGQYEQKAAAWKKELGIPEHSIVFLFAGKLEPKKDPCLLIESFKAIDHPDLRLLIAGNGVLEEELKKAASTDKRILFLDFQNQQQMPVVYRLGDVFVLPSKGPGETWGLSINEAMACSRAVIVSDRCGCAKELVKENGIIFTAQNSAALTVAMKEAASSKEHLKRKGALSKINIERFSFLPIAETLEKVV